MELGAEMNDKSSRLIGSSGSKKEQAERITAHRMY